MSYRPRAPRRRPNLRPAPHFLKSPFRRIDLIAAEYNGGDPTAGLIVSWGTFPWFIPGFGNLRVPLFCWDNEDEHDQRSSTNGAFFPTDPRQMLLLGDFSDVTAIRLNGPTTGPQWYNGTPTTRGARIEIAGPPAVPGVIDFVQLDAFDDVYVHVHFQDTIDLQTWDGTGFTTPGNTALGATQISPTELKIHLANSVAPAEAWSVPDPITDTDPVIIAPQSSVVLGP
jgi:hypothetical protein